MNARQFVPALLLASLISLPFLQAQNSTTLAVARSSKTSAPERGNPSEKRANYDLSLGQQPAHFEDLETFVAGHLSYPEAAWEYSMVQ